MANKHKIMTMQEAIEFIQSKEDDLWDSQSNSMLSFRGDDFIPVKRFRKSRYHGDDEPEYCVGGVSAIGVSWMDTEPEDFIKAACAARSYGENVFILKGTDGGYGDDYQEVVLGSHEILGIIPASEFVLPNIFGPWVLADD